MIGTDIKLTYEGSSVITNGDFSLDSDLDSAFTNRLLRASKGAWLYDPDMGIGLQDYAGLPNTAETGSTIEDAVVTGLAKAGINAQCTVYPTSFDTVAIVITVFTAGGTRSVTYSFNYEDAIVTYLESETQDTVFTTRKSSNIYDQRR